MTGIEQVIEQLGSLSYVDVFGISLLANMVIPVPEEVVLLAIGYAGRANGANFYLLVAIIMSGLLLSDIVLYALSRGGNRFVLGIYHRFFSRRLEDRRQWLEQHITKVIFFSRFLLQLRFLGPFLAGQSKVSFRTFLVWELAALLVYVPLVTWTGWYFHRSVKSIIEGIGIVHNIVLMAVAVAILIALYRTVRRRLYR